MDFLLRDTLNLFLFTERTKFEWTVANILYTNRDTSIKRLVVYFRRKAFEWKGRNKLLLLEVNITERKSEREAADSPDAIMKHKILWVVTIRTFFVTQRNMEQVFAMDLKQNVARWIHFMRAGESANSASI